MDENIPIATNIAHTPEPTQTQIQAIYIQPYRNIFQATYIIDIDNQPSMIESQPIEPPLPLPPLPPPNQEIIRRQSIIKKYTEIGVKIIAPLIIAILMIVGIYYNSAIH